MRLLRLTLAAVLALLTCTVPLLTGCGARTVVQLQDDPDGNAVVRPASSTPSVEQLASPFEVVPEKLRGAVQRAFQGIPVAETLTADLIVYRHWGGKSQELGSPWFTPTQFPHPHIAKRSLALPEDNSVEHVTAFTISKGTTILRGYAAAMIDEPGFGSGAVGGGIQIYLPDPSTAVKVGRVE